MLARLPWLKQAIAVVAIALLTAPIVPFSILIGSGEPLVWSEDHEMILGLSVISAPMILCGAVLIGIPALLAARQLGIAKSMVKLGLIGALTGAISTPIVFALLGWTPGPSVYARLMPIGGLVGLAGSVLWWRLIEKDRIKVAENA